MNNDAVVNVNLVGVGGQGILLAADVLARAAAEAGLDVKKTEIHGMSQRGGSVSSQVRFGGRVHSPIVPDGETDLLVSFDAVEAIRAFPSVRPAGRALVDKCYLVPITVSSGQQPAPEDPDATLARLFGNRLLRVDSKALAAQAGNPRTANIAIAGALSTLLDIPEDAWLAALRGRVPAKLLDANLKAFSLGRAALGA
ncbi:MAG: indolepyruvate oxidoreductase subunit beta [Kiritimatiellae bacterium]|nr:indolepyruvate oxidoreductase subunit beta [Kiritimatiellia bacterium]